MLEIYKSLYFQENLHINGQGRQLKTIKMTNKTFKSLSKTKALQNGNVTEIEACGVFLNYCIESFYVNNKITIT